MKKKVDALSVLHMLFPTKNNIVWNWFRNINWAFATNNHYETCVRDFEPKSKSQSDVWKEKNSLVQKKFWHQASKMKRMIMAYSYIDMIGRRMVVQWTSMCMYIFFAKFWGLKFDKCTKMLDRVIILHYDAYSHIATSVTTVFQEWGWKVLNHPLYSPDLSSLDYNLFWKVEELFQGFISVTPSIMTRKDSAVE